MHNLCSFAILEGEGVTAHEYPSALHPLEFTPVLREGWYPDIPVLMGYRLKWEDAILARIPKGETSVIVPRSLGAAAVGWARRRGLIPWWLPRGSFEGLPVGGTWTCRELVQAPEGLELEFPRDDALPPGFEGLGFPPVQKFDPFKIAAVTGHFPFQVGIGDNTMTWYPTPGVLQAQRRTDGVIQVPDRRNMYWKEDPEGAWIVPQDGAIIREVARVYPELAILVQDEAIPPGQPTRLYQVR